MIEDAIKSIKATLYERATSPLLGAFAASWVVVNYKFVFVLFSSMDIKERFEYIECSLYKSVVDWVLYMGLYPAIGCAFFIFVYPYPAIYVYRFWRTQQRKIKEIKSQIEQETPLTVEESREIRKQLDTITSQFEFTLEGKNREIKELEVELGRKEEQIREKERTLIEIQSSRIDSSSEGYADKIAILKMLSENSPILEADIIKELNLTRSRGLYEIGELTELALIQKTTINNKEAYQISQKGRRELIKSGSL